MYQNISSIKLELVADPVIEAIARLEFEDGEAAGALSAAAPNLGLILGGVVVIGTLLSDQTPILLSSAHRWC